MAEIIGNEKIREKKFAGVARLSKFKMFHVNGMRRGDDDDSTQLIIFPKESAIVAQQRRDEDARGECSAAALRAEIDGSTQCRLSPDLEFAHSITALACKGHYHLRTFSAAPRLLIRYYILLYLCIVYITLIDPCSSRFSSKPSCVISAFVNIGNRCDGYHYILTVVYNLFSQSSEMFV